MSDTMKTCPACHSTEIRFREKRTEWICDDCDHRWQDVPVAVPSPSPAGAIKIFLSYARKDDEPFVKRLCADLEAAGFTVWFDRNDLRSRGLTFHHEIRDAIDACDRLVLIVGPKAVASEYVRQEWQYAWFDAAKVVTPILRLNAQSADGQTIDGYEIIPDELKLLHCEDFRDDAAYADHLRNLLASLAAPPPRLGQLIAVPNLPAHSRPADRAVRYLRRLPRYEAPRVPRERTTGRSDSQTNRRTRKWVRAAPLRNARGIESSSNGMDARRGARPSRSPAENGTQVRTRLGLA